MSMEKDKRLRILDLDLAITEAIGSVCDKHGDNLTYDEVNYVLSRTIERNIGRSLYEMIEK